MPKNNNFLSYEEYQEKVANLRTASDVTNFAKELIAPAPVYYSPTPTPLYYSPTPVKTTVYTSPTPYISPSPSPYSSLSAMVNDGSDQTSSVWNAVWAAVNVWNASHSN